MQLTSDTPLVLIRIEVVSDYSRENVPVAVEPINSFAGFELPHATVDPFAKIKPEPRLKVIDKSDRSRVVEGVGRGPAAPAPGIPRAFRASFSDRFQKATAMQQTKIAQAIKAQAPVDVSCGERRVFTKFLINCLRD